MKKELICIGCPMGCTLCAELDEQGSVLAVTGNTCPRGKTYAEAELTHPTRTLTSTVRFSNRKALLPVKTDRPISKQHLLAAMAQLRDLRVAAPVRIGDVVLADLFGEANVVAAADVE